MIAETLYPSGCVLGEGAMWHRARKSFFWVDIEQKRFFECGWADKHLTTYEINFRVSLVLESSQAETILLGVQGGMMLYHLDTGQQQRLFEIERDIPDNRTNDGACDIAGRIWIGTMNVNCEEGKGGLYRLDTDGNCVKVIDKMTVPNGIAWSHDGKMMYHVESHESVVKAYRFDAITGNIEFSHNAIQVPVDLGLPDGMCMDEEGMLWIAHWNGYGVYRWDPVTGTLMSKIDVPVPQITSCAFGGDDMQTLLITSARQGMSAEQLQKYPASGDLFFALPGCKGVPLYLPGLKNGQYNKII